MGAASVAQAPSDAWDTRGQILPRKCPLISQGVLCMVLALLPSAALAQLRIVPVEKALERVSLGPILGGAATLSTSGEWGGLFTVGAAATVFDRFIIPNEECEARRAEERKRLGADKIPIWSDVVKAAQQECRPKAEYWHAAWDLGGEVGLATGRSHGGMVRGWLAPWGWQWFTLGASVTVPWTSEEVSGTTFGMRAGLEGAAHLRIISGTWRPVVTLFVRPEATVLSRDAFADQLVLGARFLFDL